jgi:hypothetical protein
MHIDAILISILKYCFVVELFEKWRPRHSGLKLVCKVNIAYGNLKSENSQDFFQKPQRNCMFMKLTSSLLAGIREVIPDPIEKCMCSVSLVSNFFLSSVEKVLKEIHACSLSWDLLPYALSVFTTLWLLHTTSSEKNI